MPEFHYIAQRIGRIALWAPSFENEGLAILLRHYIRVYVQVIVPPRSPSSRGGPYWSGASSGAHHARDFPSVPPTFLRFNTWRGSTVQAAHIKSMRLHSEPLHWALCEHCEPDNGHTQGYYLPEEWGHQLTKDQERGIDLVYVYGKRDPRALSLPQKSGAHVSQVLIYTHVCLLHSCIRVCVDSWEVRVFSWSGDLVKNRTWELHAVLLIHSASE